MVHEMSTDFWGYSPEVATQCKLGGALSGVCLLERSEAVSRDLLPVDAVMCVELLSQLHNRGCNGYHAPRRRCKELGVVHCMAMSGGACGEGGCGSGLIYGQCSTDRDHLLPLHIQCTAYCGATTTCCSHHTCRAWCTHALDMHGAFMVHGSRQPTLNPAFCAHLGLKLLPMYSTTFL